MNASEIVSEGFGRLPDLVGKAVRGLSPEELRQAPADGANTIGWLVWHLTRVQDSYLAELTGGEQIYISGDWAPKFGLEPSPSDIGYGHTAAQVAAVAPESWSVLADYYEAVHTRTMAFIEGLSDDDLDKVVDEDWDPPVTLGARLVSVWNDDMQHVGQAAYVRGLL